MPGSPYKLEQLLESERFKEIAELFIETAKTEEDKEVLKQILYEGRYGDYYFTSNYSNRDNPYIEGQRRIAMANLFRTNPETFYQLANYKLNIFHGTNANALPSILKYGLNSAQASVDQGIKVTTGEKSTRMYNLRKFVSFTDILDIAKGYATLKPEESKEELSFEVVICISSEVAKKLGTTIVQSDVCEIGIMNNVPIEDIKALIVPQNKVEFVKKMLPNDSILVLGVKTFEDELNNSTEYGGREINYEYFGAPKREPGPSIVDDISIALDRVFAAELASTRKMSRIKTMINKIKKLFGGKEEEYGRAFK